MPNLQINPAYHLELSESGLAIFISENGVEILSQAIYPQILRLCDGQHTEAEVVDHLAQEFSLPQLYYALMKLRQRGFLVAYNGKVSPESVGFWGDGAWQQKLAAAAVRVVALGDWGTLDLPALLRPYLEAADLREDENATLTLVLCQDYRDTNLAAINAQALASGNAWLLAKPVGKHIWLGPVFKPGETGCWECLHQRLRLHHQTHLRLQAERHRSEPVYTPAPFAPTSLGLALHMTVLELQKWLLSGQNLLGTVVSLDLSTLQTQRHLLMRRPQCPACGQAQYMQKALLTPPVLAAATQKISTSGGYRSQSPTQFLEDYGKHISPITGIFPRLEAPSEQAKKLHVYIAGENHARISGRSEAAAQFLRSRSMGKGNTAAQSRASALGEALERYSGQEPHFTEFASYNELGERAIHPNRCMLYSDKQYQTPRQSPATRRVPLPFDPDARQYWTPVWSLSEQRHKLLPTDFCYYRRIDETLPSYSFSDSNGCAAGATLEEAILQGFLELVERDAVAVWWYNSLQRPGVDLASFQNTHINALQDRYLTDYQREVWALDLTHDFGIPSFVALSRRVTGDMSGILMGCGSHFDPTIALTRALNEMNQCLTLILPFEEKYEISASNDSDLIYWYAQVTLENAPFLAPLPQHTRWEDFDFHATERTLLDEVQYCQNLVAQKGLEMLLLDQTLPDVGLPVVRVVVPGMRHFWERLAPGRLYDVPVEMGWLAQPTPEERVNPLPMLL